VEQALGDMLMTYRPGYTRARKVILTFLAIVVVFPGCFVWQWLLQTTAAERQAARNIRALGGTVTTGGDMSFQIEGVWLPARSLDEGQMQQLARDLQEIRYLRFLTISGEKLPLSNLAQLQRFEKLQYLDFFDTDIGDNDVEYLKQLNQLRALRLYRTRMTTEGVSQLETALPNCVIHFMPRSLQLERP